MLKMPLISILSRDYPQSSKTTLREWIKHGRISINGEIIKHPSKEYNEDQEYKLSIKSKEKKIWGGIHLIKEDRYFIAINKPSGLLSVPAPCGNQSALSILKQFYQTKSILPVHRLDRGTSGCMIFCRNKIAKDTFSQLFELHDIERKYVAIVEGTLPKNEATLTSYLEEVGVNFVRSQHYQTPENKKAITNYQVLKTNKHLSYLSLSLETGRKHQIRVQLADIGFPIIGDSVYSRKKYPYTKRILLHAYHLAFINPFTKKKVVIHTPIPEEFTRMGFPNINI